LNRGVSAPSGRGKPEYETGNLSDNESPFDPPLQGVILSLRMLPRVSPWAILYGSLREQPDGFGPSSRAVPCWNLAHES